MENRNCDLLFEYLRSILYDRKIQPLDLKRLDEPYQKLGQGLSLLQNMVEEMQEYSSALSQGKLSAKVPPRDNLLCANLKNLHANLNHLTWQAKQVADGDYSQEVSYLGEFSAAFNKMTGQLKEREEQLRAEAQNVKKRVEAIAEYNALFLELAQKRQELILVVREDSREIVYSNRHGDADRVEEIFSEYRDGRYFFPQKMLDFVTSEQYQVWEWEEDESYYRITTFPVEWQESRAFASLILDVTDDETNRQDLADKAYHDFGTGILNRRYFEEYMERALRKKMDLTLCYLDIDGLKYVNDHFGHNEGDRYINSFVEIIRKFFRSSDLFSRIGGDEFCLILPGFLKETATRKLGEALREFYESGKCSYSCSFSFGVVEIAGESNEQNLTGIIQQADEAMYKCKEINRKKYYRQHPASGKERKF